MRDDLIRCSAYVMAPFDRVWRLLTDPDAQEEWHLAPCFAFGYETGDRWGWGLPEAPVATGTLVDWEPAALFAHTFELDPLDEPPGRVEWRLAAEGEVVWIEVRHYVPEEAPETQALAVDGWSLLLSRLKTRLETGQSLPWPDPEEGSPWLA